MFKTFSKKQETGKILENGFWVIRRKGFQKPGIGDYVIVELEVYLPCESSHSTLLKEELRFEQRCKFLNSYMFSDWGVSFFTKGHKDLSLPLKGNYYRFKSIEFTGSNWKEAFV